MSQTGANADEWIPGGRGTEGILGLGVAHVILQQGLREVRSADHAGQLIAGWPQGLPEYAPPEVESRTGVAASRIVRIAREVIRNAPAAAIVGGTPLAHSNGLFNALAVNALQALVAGAAGSKEEEVIGFTPRPPIRASDSGAALAATGSLSTLHAAVEEPFLNQPQHAQTVMR